MRGSSWAWSVRGSSFSPLTRHPMAIKKKPKGVLEKIGDVVSSGAEAVVDAGAKAIHAVGELLPTGKPAPKRTRAKVAAKKAAAPKGAAKAQKITTAAKASKATASKSVAPK